MKLNDCVAGNLLEIYIMRGGYNYRVVSKLEIVREDCVAVSPIASRTRFFRFLEDDIVDIVYRVDDRMWKWSHVRAGVVIMEDGSRLHAFSTTKEAELFNRRSTYRLQLEQLLTVKYELKLSAEKSIFNAHSSMTPELTLDATLDVLGSGYKLEEVECLLKDISEGGAALLSERKMNKGDVITFELDTEAGHVYCKALIVRIKHDPKGYFDNYYGCTFLETSKNFIQFFYEMQRRELVKNKKDYLDML